MITRVQKNAFADAYVRSSQPKLNALEKAMLKWATVDAEDRVLDASIGNGLIAEYLRRNSQCEVCGVSDRMEDVRSARDRLQSCDVMYAAKGDIPWRSDSFDTVFMKAQEEEGLSLMLKEAARVLKEGGQLVLGLKSCPIFVEKAISLLSDEESTPMMTRQSCEKALKEAGFHKTLWNWVGPLSAVVVAWTKNEYEEELIRAGQALAE